MTYDNKLINDNHFTDQDSVYMCWNCRNLITNPDHIGNQYIESRRYITDFYYISNREISMKTFPNAYVLMRRCICTSCNEKKWCLPERYNYTEHTENTDEFFNTLD